VFHILRSTFCFYQAPIAGWKKQGLPLKPITARAKIVSFFTQTGINPDFVLPA